MTEAVAPETLNKVLWKIPNVLCLIGSRHGDEWNGMTQSWVTQVAMEPVLVAASIDVKAVTNRLIRNGGVVHRQPLGPGRHAAVRQVLEAGVKDGHDAQRQADS